MTAPLDDSWKAHYMPEDVAHIEELEKHEILSLRELAKELKLLQPRLPLTHHMQATPLIELSSISLRTNTIPELEDDNPVLAVYGNVQLIDYDTKNVFTLFHRESSAPRYVPLLDNDDISVIIEKSELGCPHLLPKSFVLEISLRDFTRGICLINAKREIMFKSNVPYDKDVDIEFSDTSGMGGDFRVCCTVFQCAVVANVEFVVHRIEGGSDEIEPYAYVSGTIFATYRGRNDSHKRLLFDKVIEPKFEDPVKLAPLAVPAYSFLTIYADLTVNGEKIVCNDDPWECKAKDNSCSAHEKEILGHKYRVVLRGRWEHLLDNGFPEWNDTQGVSSEEDEADENSFSEWRDIPHKGRSTLMNPQGKTLPRHKKPRRSHDQDPPRTLLKRYRIVSVVMPQEFVELFSISVFRHNEDVVSLCGTIESYDMNGRNIIFDRDMSKPEILHHSSIVLLRDLGRCYEGSIFGFELDLKDAEGVDICRGIVSVSDHTVRPDRRVCSVIPGIGGFACVHYTMFTDATRASVKVIFKSKSGLGVYEVHGSILARYSSYKYSTHYDLKYYQSIIFEKDAKNQDEVGLVELNDGDEIPLLKRMVSVPLNASLIVDVNLNVGIKGDTTSEVVKVRGKAKFKAEMNEPNFLLNYHEPKFKNGNPEIKPRTIGDSNDDGYEVLVFVEWI